MSKFSTTKRDAEKAAKIINKAFGCKLVVFRNDTEFYQLTDGRTFVTELPMWNLQNDFVAAGLNVWFENQNEVVLNVYPGEW